VGLAAIAMAAGLATTPAFAGDDKGERGKPDHANGKNGHGHGNGHGNPPAHANAPAAQPAPAPQPQESQPAKPAKPAKPHAHKPAKPAQPSKPQAPKPAKPAKPAHPATPHAHKPVKPAKPADKPAKPAEKPANPHAKAGKTTICHATGSATNPYVTITISNNALPAHARHQDGRDIIPAPASGCPAPAPAKGVAIGKADLAEGQVAGPPAESPAAPAPAPAAAAPASEQLAAAPAGGVLGVTSSGANPLPKLAATPGAAKAAERKESGTRPATAAAQPKAGQLPFTGLEAALVALIGLLLVGAGLAMRKLWSTPRQPLA
jgi:hypothetical protein